MRYLERALGRDAGKAPTFTFGDALANNATFIAAAVTIEDTGLAAYNGQAENMSRATLESVARVISVEVRHAGLGEKSGGQATGARAGRRADHRGRGTEIDQALPRLRR